MNTIPVHDQILVTPLAPVSYPNNPLLLGFYLFSRLFWLLFTTVSSSLSRPSLLIELPMPPAGEGSQYEAYCKDLRPYLNWSEREGWTLPTVRGRSSGGAQLIFPSKQGTGLEVENAAGSPLNVSSITPTSVEGDSERQSKDAKMDNNFTEGDMKKQSSDHVNTVICEEKVQSEDVKMDDVFAEGDAQKQISYPVDTVICEENVQSKDVNVEFAVGDAIKQSPDPVDTVIFQEKEPTTDVKMDDEFALAEIKKQSPDPAHTVMDERVQCEDVKMNDDVGSSDNTSSLCVEESKAAVDECDIDGCTSLNIMHEYTLEAAVTDLEELANKIKWMKAILNNNGNHSWKFELFPSH